MIFNRFINVKPEDSKIEVTISSVAESLAEQTSTEQSVFLYEFFDAIKHKCNDKHKFDSQLIWIATELKRQRHFKETIEHIELLNQFLKHEVVE